MDSTNKIIARVAGAILVVAGVGLVALGALATSKHFASDDDLVKSTILMILALFALGGWLGWMGFRLAADRPNRHGSLLTPAGWYVLAWVLLSLCVALLAAAIWKRDPTILGGVPFGALMTWWCWSAASTVRKRSEADATSQRGFMIAGQPGKEYLHLISIGGVPISVHPSLPFGGLLFAVYAGFDAGNVVYYCLGYFLLIGLHEAAHAVAAKAVGLKVTSIHLSGVGGVCHVEPPRHVWHAVIVYSAGIVIQLVLLMAALGYLMMIGEPVSEFGKSMIATFTVANAIVVVFNLIPTKTSDGFATDGSVLLQLFQHVFRSKPHPFQDYLAVPADQSPVLPPETNLMSIPSFVPQGFEQGVEILNDKTTPMEFVLSSLVQHLGLNEHDAFKTMVHIHNNGGILIALPSKERADAVAVAITADSSQHGYALVCRAVGAKV